MNKKAVLMAILFFTCACALTVNAEERNLQDGTSSERIFSSWAETEIENGIKLGFVPISIRDNYQRPITRSEFAKIAVYFLSMQYGYQPEYVIQTYGSANSDFSMREFKNAYCSTQVDRNENAFKDNFGERNYEFSPGTEFYFPSTPFMDLGLSDDQNYIEMAYHMGIINGASETEFNPDGQITRQEAAAMLFRVYKNYSSGVDEAGDILFLDDPLIADWAKESVYCMACMDVMQGVGNGLFAPLEVYTVEQSIASFLRLYNIAPVSRKNKNVKPLLEFEFERDKFFVRNSSETFYEIDRVSYSDFELVYGYWARRHQHNVDYKLYIFYLYGGMRDLTSFVNVGQINEIPIEGIEVSEDEKAVVFWINIADTFILHNHIDEVNYVYGSGRYKLEIDIGTGNLLGLEKTL